MPRHKFTGDESVRGGRTPRRSAGPRQELGVPMAEVEAAMRFDTVEAVKKSLATIAQWAMAGRVSGSTANAAASCCREWIKGNELEMNVTRIKRAEQEIKRLKAELEQRRPALMR